MDPVSTSSQWLRQLNKRHRRFFSLARELSFKSDHTSARIGAIIVRTGNVVSVGFNRQSKTHPSANSFHGTLHAEVDAIVGVDRGSIRSGVCYVYRETRSGMVGMSKPCLGCQVALQRAGIKKVFYSNINIFGEMKL